MTVQTATTSRSSVINWDVVLDRTDYVAFDTENNGHINLFDDGVVIHGFSICVKIDGQYLAEYFPVAHSRGINYERFQWEPILRKVLKKKIIAHNVNFDARSARLLLGEDFDEPFEYFFDTANMAHLVNENLFDPKQGGPLTTPSLENCCKFFLRKPGKEKSVIFNALMSLYGWAGIAPSEIREYAEADAVAAYELWEELAKRLAAEKGADNINFWRNVEMPNMKVLYHMKHLGVKVNVEFCKEWEQRCYDEMETIRGELGFDPAKPSQLAPVIYDELGLPKLYNKKKRKNPDGTTSIVQSATFDSKAMEKYDKMMEHLDNPIARKIIQYRGWSQAVSLYYRPYQEFVDPDGRMRCDYKSHGTLNRRYSSSKPNLQQIPKTDPDLMEIKPWSAHVKECFIPMQGHQLWEFDYSQLELRLGAMFGMDKKLLEIFNDPNERDIFTEMAAEMGWPRQKCKSFVYSIDYGAGPGRVAEIFNVTPEQGARYIEDFYDQYPGLGGANDKAKYEATTTARLRYWTGHYRHFMKKEEAYKAFNSKIQGGSADLVKIVMNNIRREMPEVRMLLQIHDALVFEFPTGKVESYSADVRRIMENPFKDKSPVVFKVDGHRFGGMELAA